MKRAQKPTDINRRRLFAAGVALAGGAGVAAAGSAADGPEGRQPVTSPFGPDLTANQLVNGKVVEAQGNGNVLIQDATRSKVVRVTLASGAIITRDGAAELAELAVGDEIAAQGTWDADGVFHARAIAPMFSAVVASVVERRGDRLVTDEGGINLTSKTVASGGHGGESEGGIHFKKERLTDIRAGQGVFAYGFYPGGGPDLCAASIGVTGE